MRHKPPLTLGREARGWSAREFARRLCELGARRGVPVGTRKDGIYRWERRDAATGRIRHPDAPTQRLIARPICTCASLPAPTRLEEPHDLSCEAHRPVRP